MTIPGVLILSALFTLGVMLYNYAKKLSNTYVSSKDIRDEDIDNIM